MAEDTPVDTDYTEPEGTVTLVSPSGAEYRTHNAVEINNLIYGQGYKLKNDEPESADQAELSSWGGTPVRTEGTSAAADNSAAATVEASAAPNPSPAGSKTAAKASPKAPSDKAAGGGTLPPASTT